MVKSQVEVMVEEVKAGRHKFLSLAFLTFPNRDSIYISCSRSHAYSFFSSSAPGLYCSLIPSPASLPVCLDSSLSPYRIQGHFTYQQRNLDIRRPGHIWVQILTLLSSVSSDLAVYLPNVKITLAEFEFLHL